MFAELIFYVNGKQIVETCPDPEINLALYLRTKLQLCGTKMACGQGGCGACTVMLSRYDRVNRKITHYCVNACLTPICALHGLAVTTVEGIGNTKTKLHPVQERIAKSFGTQCGFCTPGMVMSMYTLLRNDPHPTMAQVETVLQGNLCRCTGYRPILDGFRTLTKDGGCGLGEQCCKNKNLATEEGTTTILYDKETLTQYDPTQEPIFPSQLQLSDEFDNQCLCFKGQNTTWYRPVILDSLVDLKSKYPDAFLSVGNTKLASEIKFKGIQSAVIISVNNIPELKLVTSSETGITIGSSVTISELASSMKRFIQEMPGHNTKIFSTIEEQLKWFGSEQIRNVVGIGSCVTNENSDLLPIFIATGVAATVMTKDNSTRTITIDGEFLNVDKPQISSTDLLVSFHIPYSTENDYIKSYKQSRRQYNDLATVNCAMKVTFDDGKKTIKDISLCYCGVGRTPIVCSTARQHLIGRVWDDAIVEEASHHFEVDFPGTANEHDAYKTTLACSFFFKFYLAIALELRKNTAINDINVDKNDESAAASLTRTQSQGIQIFEEQPNGQLEHDTIGRPIAHAAAMQQSTGEALFCDDIPPAQGELYVGLVLATKANAKIMSIDWTQALGLPGVVDKVDVTDIPSGGSNISGPIRKDEVIFADGITSFCGQALGCVLAADKATAQKAARLVKIEYEQLQPVIVTIEQALENNSFFDDGKVLESGDLSAAFTDSDHVLEGDFCLGAHNAFYMEPQCVVVRPTGECGEMELFSSTQGPTQLQLGVGAALGVAVNKVTVRSKRMGGGFGAKEDNSTRLAIVVAVASAKVGRSVRCFLDRHEDMLFASGTHSFLAKYKVGYKNDGAILGCDVNLYCNGGYATALGPEVLDVCLDSMDNSYRIPSMKVTARLCKTNRPPSSGFRGFGSPQAFLVIEHIMSVVADKLYVPQYQLREKLLYKEGDRRYINDIVQFSKIQECWHQVIESSNFNERRTQIEDYNRSNKWRKRGIAVIPVNQHIAFPLSFLYQGSALVHVYLDGSILITHGGTEMGQGLHTKMLQIASRVLEVPFEKIHISETSTSTIANTTPTGGSTSSDLYGHAVIKACTTIKDRLATIRESMPNAKWEDWIGAAYFNRVNLSASGFYAPEGTDFDFTKLTGDVGAYDTCGSAVSEVEIDCLTGSHKVMRTDIVMDVGRSMNPGIDIGQIEGAFIQGLGRFTLEEQLYNPDGSLYTSDLHKYTIPTVSNIPEQFNVTLLKDGSRPPKAVYSSKGIGEPPLFLSASVFFAIREAVLSARRERGLADDFRFDAPATAARIRMVCEDQFVQVPDDASAMSP